MDVCDLVLQWERGGYLCEGGRGDGLLLELRPQLLRVGPQLLLQHRPVHTEERLVFKKDGLLGGQTTTKADAGVCILRH